MSVSLPSHDGVLGDSNVNQALARMAEPPATTWLELEPDGYGKKRYQEV